VICVYYGTASFVVVSEWSSLKELESTHHLARPSSPHPSPLDLPTPLTYMPPREKRREGWGEKREESVCAYLAGTFERLQPIPRLALTEPAYLYGRTDDAGIIQGAARATPIHGEAGVCHRRERSCRARGGDPTDRIYLHSHSNLHWNRILCPVRCATSAHALPRIRAR
jgi:hypothetical protein